MSGLLLVEWHDGPADYHHWYDTVHLHEILTIDGFVTARRLDDAKGAGRCLAVYDVAGDVTDAKAALFAWMRSGEMTPPPDAVPSPPPVMTWFTTSSSGT